MENLAAAVLSSVLLVAALRVIAAGSALRSALALIVAQVAMGGLYVVLLAPVIASLQILLYAGAVMVLFVFVIMLLHLGPESLPLRWHRSPLGIAAGLGLLASALSLIYLPPSTAPIANAIDGSMRHVGGLLLTRYAFHFEAISVILLTAVVGSVVLCLRRLT